VSDEDAGVEFTLKLGRALQSYGAPAHRLEDAMREVVETLGIEGEFFSTPTVIFASLGSGGVRRVHLLRAESGEVDLEKMTRLAESGNAVIEGRLSPSEGSAAIDRILAAPPPYGRLATVASFGVVSAAASRFFDAGPRELLLVLVAGLVVGTMAMLAERYSWLGRIFIPAAAFVVSLIATIGALVVGPVSAPIVTVAGLIVLVPGFTLTVAVNELAQRSLISGTARLHGAVLTFLMLGFGVALGGTIGSRIVGGTSLASAATLPRYTEWLAVVVAGVSLGVLFRAPRRDLIWIVLSCLVTFAAVKLTSGPLGPPLGVFIGALVAGVASNAYARILDRPTAVTRVPSMMLLVPGSLGFLSISSLLDQDIVKGLQTAFTVSIMAVALVTGLLISNAIVPPGRKKL
jgi:uncharacterized membrane protein YjjP (DUF1212 family)